MIASAESLSRDASGARCIATSRMAPIITNFPLSCPCIFWRSSSEVAVSITAAPVTFPLVLALHARGTAAIWNGCGPTAWNENRSLVQPRPNGPQLSKCGLAKPHPFIVARAQSPAAWVIGEPVSRGPCTSVSQLMRSMTCDRCMASVLMRSIVATSTFSCAARPAGRAPMVNAVAVAARRRARALGAKFILILRRLVTKHLRVAPHVRWCRTCREGYGATFMVFPPSSPVGRRSSRPPGA